MVSHCAADPAVDAAQAIVTETGISRGLIVHVGCGDGTLTAALANDEGRLVHGLDSDVVTVRRAREHLRSLGLYGRATVERWVGPRLPYRDEMVSLLVCEGPDQVSEAEIMRVLRPRGAAVVMKGHADEGWRVLRKPWPQGMDQWTHALYDASNNAVGHDALVGPPHHVRWVDGPTFTRHHHFLSGVTAVVSANARLFAIVDEAPAAFIALPSEWCLVARDAFNGVVLWKRDIPTWGPQFRAFASGPPELSRRLVAVEDRVYVTLGLDAPLSMLDAASGETLKTYDGTEGTEEVLYDAGVLYVVTGNPVGERTTAALELAHYVVDAARRNALMAIDAQTGNVLWRKTGEQVSHLLPMGLAVADGRAVFQNGDSVVCLDAKTGRELWRFAREADRVRPGWSSPTVVICDGVVLSFDREPNLPPRIDRRTGQKRRTTGSATGKLFALSVETGAVLWNCDATETLCCPGDVFVIDGLVWAGHATGRGAQEPDFTVARDLRTGEIVKTIKPDEAFTTIHHHRCYRNRATERYIMVGRTGIEFIDLASGDAMRHNWVRGACQYGIVPSNGLLYAPPHSCACYVQSQLNGFWALAPKRASKGTEGTERTERLKKGPAYSEVRGQESEIRNQTSEVRDTGRASSRAAGSLNSDLRPLTSGNDWPTYRRDAARSGCTAMSVSPDVAPLWRRTVGERISSPAVAGGRVFVASVDEHAVHCLDATTGKDLWHYVADGRVDSPPTCSGGLVVFGAADGCVYCLRATDGVLVWRFCAAPRAERVVSYGRLESPWPVHGSVLVQDGAVYCAAGRSSYLDDGIYLYRLDLATGKVLAQRRLWSRDATGRQPEDKVVVMEMEGFLPDVLSSDGDSVYMRHAGFAPGDLQDRKTSPHLMSVSGLLDGDWWHRSYWAFGTLTHSCCWGAMTAMREVPTGRLMVFDDTTLYGYGRQYWEIKGLAHTRPNPHHLWGIRKDGWPEQTPPTSRQDFTERARSKTEIKLNDFAWSKAVPLHARAMVLAGKTLFMAGPPALDITEEDTAHSPTGVEHRLRVADQTLIWRGMLGALLCAVSTEDGDILSQAKLDSLPVWDGLIAANNRLYMSTATGEVVCLGQAK